MDFYLPGKAGDYVCGEASHYGWREDNGPCWLALWDWHTFGAGGQDRWHSSPGIGLTLDGKMKVTIGWGDRGTQYPDLDPAALPSIPTEQWFTIEMHYTWSTTPVDVTVWLNGQEAFVYPNVITKDPAHDDGSSVAGAVVGSIAAVGAVGGAAFFVNKNRRKVLTRLFGSAEVPPDAQHFADQFLIKTELAMGGLHGSTRYWPTVSPTSEQPTLTPSAAPAVSRPSSPPSAHPSAAPTAYPVKGPPVPSRCHDREQCAVEW
eukprot:gene56415-25665_t